MTVTRDTEGFTSFPKGHPLETFDFTNPITHPYFFEDFNAYDKTQLIGGSPWKFTVENACVDTIVGPKGVLALTLGGTDNDSGLLQLTEASWQTDSKRLYFMARFNLTLAGGTIAANQLFVGLSSAQTGANFMASDGLSLTMDDALGFYALDTDASMSVTMREADASSVDTETLTLTSATWVTVAIVYDGTEAKFYTSTLADGADMRTDAPVATLTGNDVTSVLTPALFVKAGGAQANVLNTDYVFVGGERG